MKGDRWWKAINDEKRPTIKDTVGESNLSVFQNEVQKDFLAKWNDGDGLTN